MNIPPEVARSQGKHGIKGAAHGIKGGRPRLDLTEEQRVERRRAQQEAYRRRQGIPAGKVAPDNGSFKSWGRAYVDIWGKPPGEPQTPEEFARGEPLWNAEVLRQQEAARHREAEEQRRKPERRKRWEERGWYQFTPPPFPVAATPSVGRNQPCPCKSGRKFKKCCGR